MINGINNSLPVHPGDISHRVFNSLNKADTNGDKVISAEESKLPEDRFSNVDTNGDGQLGVVEIRTFVKRLYEHSQTVEGRIEPQVAEVAVQSIDLQA